MQRQIFIVTAYVVDANGTINPASRKNDKGETVIYPVNFDSKNYGNDIDKALKRAQGEFSDCKGAMCKRDDRQLQSVTLMTADGFQLDRWADGKIADVEPNAE